jgi:hypothetical protein
MTKQNVKSALSSFGNGLLNAAAVTHNASINRQIDEIDAKIAELQEQKTSLERQRIDYR